MASRVVLNPVLARVCGVRRWVAPVPDRGLPHRPAESEAPPHSPCVDRVESNRTMSMMFGASA